MKRILYIIVLLVSLVSCSDAGDRRFPSPELATARNLMRNDPQAALHELQRLDSLYQYGSSPENIYRHEYSVLLAEAYYKNYLPQSNFTDVEAATAFYDRNGEAGGFENARAHYYHAVGLTEKDDIVGACEHYLKALDIMEAMTNAIKENDYEKLRFIYLIHTRLGEIFLDAIYVDLALDNFKHALAYVDMFGNTYDKANTLKQIGNTYQLTGQSDSALYYYNESLKEDANLGNKLDVEKCVAKILFEKGEKDSAYRMVKNNMEIIQNQTLQWTYHLILGQLFYMDCKYDSAIQCLNYSFTSSHKITQTASASMLSAIYDSIGDIKNKYYYSDIVSDYALKKVNENVDMSKIQNAHNEYYKSKNNRRNHNIKKNIIIGIIVALTFILPLIILIIYKNKNKLNKILDEKDRMLLDSESKLQKTEQELQYINKKLKNKTTELNRLRTINNIAYDNIKSYYDSEICDMILNKLRKMKELHLKSSELGILTHNELMLLLHSANAHLNNIVDKLSNEYPDFNNIDMYCICLLILGADTTQIAFMLNKDYKTVWRRIKKINKILEKNNNYKFIFTL